MPVVTTALQTENADVLAVSAPPLPPFPTHWRSLASVFVAEAKAHPAKIAFADSTGTELTYAESLLRATALGKAIGRIVGPARYVGVLIPPTAHAAVANIAITLIGKVPVNLNYTASESVVNSCIDQCGITHVLTSRRAIDKFKLTPKGELLFLEDMPKRVGKMDKAAAFAASKLPAFLLPIVLPGLRGSRIDEAATIIFTSGSTAEPKGVVLTHGNVLSNMLQIKQHVHLNESDVVLGILPFFHSFGFTVTLWTMIGAGLKGVYHFSPLDSKIVGNLCDQQGATVMAATPTFMRGYLQRCPPEQFRTLRLLIVGAEKLKPELCREIKEKLGVDPLEGYGCTETGPVVSVNRPFDVRLPDGRTIPGNRIGTVGQLLPGTSVRVVDSDTSVVLPPTSEGIIELKGPQVMSGYLNKAEMTAKVLKDGWYHTGDLGMVDADGFLKITGRLSRFAKIGGEMVPHHAVEAAIIAAAGVDESAVAVTSVPDPKRGEHLVVIHTQLPVEITELVRALQKTSLPRLWIPGADDFVQVDTLPFLGTGKLDLRELRRIADDQTKAHAEAPKSA